MKFTNFQRKSVSLIVLATFVALLHFWATPIPAATSAGNSETAIAQGDSGGPSFVEQESSSEPVYQRSKKFPWLFVGLGVVAVGVAVYFLVIVKPKYTLTVTVGTNCTGIPVATAKYKKDTAVPYNYTASAGYYVKVKLDGIDVADSGTVTMDKDHALTVTAEPFSIAGSWSLNEVYTNGANYTATFTFTETVAGVSGTYRTTDGDYGTWTKNLLNVRIESDYYSYMVYTGSFTAKNKMSGTCLARFTSGLVNGTWTATKTSASPHTPAATQSGPKKQIKNN